MAQRSVSVVVVSTVAYRAEAMRETQRFLPTGFQETLVFLGYFSRCYSRSDDGHGCPGGRIVRKAVPKANVPVSVLWLKKMEPKWTDSARPHCG